jgi:hypothetical protein
MGPVHGGSASREAVTLAPPRALLPWIVMALCENKTTPAVDAAAQTSPSQRITAGIVPLQVAIITYLRIAFAGWRSRTICLSGSAI